MDEICILPRLQSEPVGQLPFGIVQLAPSAGKLSYALRALWLAVSHRPDVVYCGHAFMASLAHLVAKIAGAKLVVHVHGLEVWQPLNAAARQGIAAADIVLCVSRHTLSKVVEVTGSDPTRCAVIYNTVGKQFTPADRSLARAKFGVPLDATVLTTVARLDTRQQHKGHDRVIPLLAELSKEIPNLVYLVAGTGDDRIRLERLAQSSGAGDIVRFLGFVADSDLVDLYSASDLYVMPSHGEGFGIAFIEAMACGTPALGLNVGGAADALLDGELGQAVALEDFPEALRQALLARPSDRKDLSCRTHSIFGRDRFSKRLAAALTPVKSANTGSEEAML